ncbi:MAG: hypothetical protein IKS09_06285, partial [Lachnospiraceae bacterium]|nr:hypothetical protein [Lachnospiraceae bacterium]
PESANSYIEFKELSKIAKEMHLKAKYFPQKGASTPAFTLVFKSGRDTQGKTAAQVLKENTNGRDILASQREFLAKNVAKYRSNQQFIDAIDEALSLSNEQINAAEDSVEIILFNSGLRSNTYRTKNGKAFCYNGSVKFYPGADSPLKVDVDNFYAPIETDDKGLNKILVDKAEDKVSASINLNFGEALRLFAELEEYFMIKYDELERKGIEESEKLLSSQRGSKSTKAKASDDEVSLPVNEANCENKLANTSKEEKAESKDNNNTANDTAKSSNEDDKTEKWGRFTPAKYGEMSAGFAVQTKDGDAIVFNPQVYKNTEKSRVEQLRKMFVSGKMADFTCTYVISKDKKYFLKFA